MARRLRWRSNRSTTESDSLRGRFSSMDRSAWIMSGTLTSSSVDLVDGPVLGPVQHLLEGLDQVEQRDRQLRALGLVEERLDLRVRPDVLLDQQLLLQHLGGVLEALVLEEAIDQFLARVLFRGDLVERRVAREQHSGLDVDERRGHVDELGAQFDVELEGPLHVLQVLGGDGGDGDVVDVDLLLADQVQQQIKRPLIVFQMKVQRRRHNFSR